MVKALFSAGSLMTSIMFGCMILHYEEKHFNFVYVITNR